MASGKVSVIEFINKDLEEKILSDDHYSGKIPANVHSFNTKSEVLIDGVRVLYVHNKLTITNVMNKRQLFVKSYPADRLNLPPQIYKYEVCPWLDKEVNEAEYKFATEFIKNFNEACNVELYGLTQDEYDNLFKDILSELLHETNALMALRAED